jgi:hypothetical protein
LHVALFGFIQPAGGVVLHGRHEIRMAFCLHQQL